MHEELLASLGLTKSEIAVYLVLLRIGSSTTGPIIHEADIAAGKAYLILDKLSKKGLVTHVIRSGTKHYQANDPARLLDYLHEQQDALKAKERELQRLLPELRAQYTQTPTQTKAEIFEGVKGFKTFYEWMLTQLEKGDTIDIMGVPREANERFGAFFMDWDKRAVRKGIALRIIYNESSRKYGGVRKNMKLTRVRYMKPSMETPAWVDVFKDYVATIEVRGEPTCFLLKNEESAQSYRKFFEMMWRQSRE